MILKAETSEESVFLFKIYVDTSSVSVALLFKYFSSNVKHVQTMTNKNNETHFVETDVYSIGLLIGKSH